MKLCPKIILEGTRGEQEVMQRFVTASSLVTLQLDISDDNVPQAIQTVADWLESIDGLYTHEE